MCGKHTCMFRHNVIINHSSLHWSVWPFWLKCGGSSCTSAQFCVYPPWPLPGRAVLTSLGVVLQSSLFLGVVGASSPVHSLLWKSGRHRFRCSTSRCGAWLRGLVFCWGIRQRSTLRCTTKLRVVPNATSGKYLVDECDGDVSCAAPRSRFYWAGHAEDPP